MIILVVTVDGESFINDYKVSEYKWATDSEKRW